MLNSHQLPYNLFVLCFTKWSIFAKHHSSTLSCQTDSWQANNQNLSAVPTLLRRQTDRPWSLLLRLQLFILKRACSRAVCQFVSFVYWLWKWQGMERINHCSKWETTALMTDHPSLESTLSETFPSYVHVNKLLPINDQNLIETTIAGFSGWSY